MAMKTLLLLLATLVPALSQTHIAFDAADFNASPATNRVVQFQPLSPFRGNIIEQTTDTNGLCYLSNALVSDYAFTIKNQGAAQAIRGQLTVTSTSLGVVDAIDITSVAGAQTYPESGKSAWSITASDARLLATNTALISRITAATNGITSGTSGALTNNETRSVVFSADVTALSIETISTAYVGESLSAAGVVARSPGVFQGSGASLTDIPLTGVTGLTNALDYFTNNIGGTSGALTNNDTRSITLSSNLVAIGGIIASNVGGVASSSSLSAYDPAGVRIIKASDDGINIAAQVASGEAGDSLLILKSGDGLVIADSQYDFNGSGVLLGNGSGLTNISLAAVTGLTNALTYFTNNIGGGGTITAASLSSGTNSFAGNGSGLTNVGTDGFTPNHMNLGSMTRTAQRLGDRLPMKMLWIRDDQVKPEATVLAAMGQFMSRNGSLSYNGSDTYVDWNGLGTLTAANGGAAGHPLWPGVVFGMATGCRLTNINAIGSYSATRAVLRYFPATGFGTLTIHTNGSVLATINADNGQALGVAVQTNFNFALANLTNVTVTSTGTNLVIGCVGTYDTNASAGIVAELWAGGDYSLGSFLNTANRSNSFMNFMRDSDYDVLLFSDIGTPEVDMLTWDTVARANNIHADQVWLTPPPVFTAASNTVFTMRSNQFASARITQRALIDLTPYYYPYPVAITNGMYNITGPDDLLHTGESSWEMAGRVVLDTLGWGSLSTYGWTNDLPRRAILAAANTWSGAQNFSTLTAGAGNTSFASTGSLAGFNFQSRSGGSSPYGRIWMAGSGSSSAIYIAGSAWGTDQGLVITNYNGRFGLYADPLFNWESGTPGLGTTASPWWLTATNSEMYGATRFRRTGNTNAFAYFASDGTLTNGLPLGLTNSQSINTLPLATSATTAAWSSNVTLTTVTATTVTGNGSGLTNLVVPLVSLQDYSSAGLVAGALNTVLTNYVNILTTQTAMLDGSITSGRVTNLVAGATLKVEWSVGRCFSGAGEAVFVVYTNGVATTRYTSAYLNNGIAGATTGRGMSFHTVLDNIGAGTEISMGAVANASGSAFREVAFTVTKLK